MNVSNRNAASSIFLANVVSKTEDSPALFGSSSWVPEFYSLPSLQSKGHILLTLSSQRLGSGQKFICESINLKISHRIVVRTSHGLEKWPWVQLKKGGGLELWAGLPNPLPTSGHLVCNINTNRNAPSDN